MSDISDFLNDDERQELVAPEVRKALIQAAEARHPDFADVMNTGIPELTASQLEKFATSNDPAEAAYQFLRPDHASRKVSAGGSGYSKSSWS